MIAATDKQKTFVAKLGAERGLDFGDMAGWSKQHASRMIERLLATPKLEREDAPKRESAPVGFYMLEDSVVRVVQSKSSGRTYAKRLEVSPAGVARWEYAPGAVWRVSAADALTTEQAAAFGHRYGVCAVCGRELTNDESVTRGIGPVCAGKI